FPSLLAGFCFSRFDKFSRRETEIENPYFLFWKSLEKPINCYLSLVERAVERFRRRFNWRLTIKFRCYCYHTIALLHLSAKPEGWAVFLNRIRFFRLKIGPHTMQSIITAFNR